MIVSFIFPSIIILLNSLYGHLLPPRIAEKVCGTNLVTYDSAEEVRRLQAIGMSIGIVGFGTCMEVCLSRDPICGSDARTYYNYCHLAFAMRRREQVTYRHAGHCRIVEKYVALPGSRPAHTFINREEDNEFNTTYTDQSPRAKKHLQILALKRALEEPALRQLGYDTMEEISYTMGKHKEPVYEFQNETHRIKIVGPKKVITNGTHRYSTNGTYTKVVERFKSIITGLPFSRRQGTQTEEIDEDDLINALKFKVKARNGSMRGNTVNIEVNKEEKEERRLKGNLHARKKAGGIFINHDL